MAKGELISCVACGHEVAKSAKACPNCGAAPKKPFTKTFNGKLIKWIFILYIFIALDFVLNGRTLPGGTYSPSITTESSSTTEDGADLGILDYGTTETTNDGTTEDLTGEGTSPTDGTELNPIETTGESTSNDTGVVEDATTPDTEASTDEPLVNPDGTIDPVQIGN